MQNEHKKQYGAPEVISLGSVVELTAALGGGGQQDQSDYPAEFPPSTGSFDVCNNNAETTVC